ncbi:MAG: iron ABC transporter [Deltaproteobacteria bacterium]|jgi:iron complex transport system permease protein|nr:MAG: iron ABC transporter [Deltaproteobacteria bacterium]
MNVRRKLIVSLTFLFILWILTVWISLFSGTYEFNPVEVFSGNDEMLKTILLKIRVPRVLMASIAGGVFAISGAALQALFRNPLASPLTLGISGGASLGALIAIRLRLNQGLLGFSSTSICAFLLSILTIFFVYSVSRIRGVVATGRLLLAGVVANFLFSALILFIQFFSDFIQSLQTIRWIMGSLDIVGMDPVWKTCVLIAPPCIVLVSITKDMNLLALGDDVAHSLGVRVKTVEKTIYFATSFAVSSVISVTGPIGFVGLIVPHILRVIVGMDNRILLPCSFLLGASFLTMADTLARTLFSPVEIPVGIFTALIGGVFFLWLLFRTKKEIIL